MKCDPDIDMGLPDGKATPTINRMTLTPESAEDELKLWELLVDFQNGELPLFQSIIEKSQN